MEVLISLVTPSLKCRYITFRSRHLADLLSDYFDAAWHDAIVLKDIDTIRLDLLDEITQRMESMGPLAQSYRISSNSLSAVLTSASAGGLFAE